MLAKIVTTKKAANPSCNKGRAMINPPTVPQVPGARLGSPLPNPIPNQYTTLSRAVAPTGNGGHTLALLISGL